MQAQAQSFSEQDIADIAAYLSEHEAVSRAMTITTASRLAIALPSPSRSPAAPAANAGRAFVGRPRRRPHQVVRRPARRATSTPARSSPTTKGKATGQACVDCHGAEGNAPIDPTYPKLGGQYYDYIAHSLETYRDGDREQR